MSVNSSPTPPPSLLANPATTSSPAGRHFSLMGSIYDGNPVGTYYVPYQLDQRDISCSNADEDPICAITSCLNFCDSAFNNTDAQCDQMLLTKSTASNEEY